VCIGQEAHHGLLSSWLCIDAREPEAQARFWAGLLDGEVVDDRSTDPRSCST
jgi:hypothetical protein